MVSLIKILVASLASFIRPAAFILGAKVNANNASAVIGALNAPSPQDLKAWTH